MDYRKEIDGLRALAVLPVILFHAGYEVFRGGFVGVDIFFVISGYLITTIIVGELEQGRFTILDFYERRARRILPALFLVMLVCIPFAWIWLMPDDMKGFSRSMAAVSVFSSNILFWHESGYFDAAAELKPLLHTWSLAVEEQYYVFFPMFLLLFWRLGRRWLLVLLILAFVLSLGLSQWAAYARPATAFYLLPARGWELLIGAFAAFHMSRAQRGNPERWVRELGAWLGLAFILGSVFTYSKATPFPGLYALAPTLGTVLVILFASPETLAGRLLGNRLLVGLGLISYSAYLWHQPLFAFARHRSLAEPSAVDFLLLSLLSLLLAYGSWRYVESYFRNRKVVSRRAVFTFSACGGLLFLSFGLLGYLGDGLAGLRFNDSQLQTINSASSSPMRSACHFPREEAALGREPCRYFSDKVKVAVVGNSHATELAYTLAELLKDHDIGIVQHTMSGCPHNYKVSSEAGTVCGRWHEKVFESISSDRSIEVVVLSYRNEKILQDGKYREALANLANDLVDAGKRVVLVLQAPMPMAHISRHLNVALPDLSGSIPSRKLADWRDAYGQSRVLLGLLKPEVAVLDPADLFCDGEYCYVTQKGVSLFFDDHHMSVSGARLVARQLLGNILDGKRL